MQQIANSASLLNAIYCCADMNSVSSLTWVRRMTTDNMQIRRNNFFSFYFLTLVKITSLICQTLSDMLSHRTFGSANLKLT